jgi:hypothetical protein
MVISGNGPGNAVLSAASVQTQITPQHRHHCGILTLDYSGITAMADPCNVPGNVYSSTVTLAANNFSA